MNNHRLFQQRGPNIIVYCFLLACIVPFLQRQFITFLSVSSSGSNEFNEEELIVNVINNNNLVAAKGAKNDSVVAVKEQNQQQEQPSSEGSQNTTILIPSAIDRGISDGSNNNLNTIESPKEAKTTTADTSTNNLSITTIIANASTSTRTSTDCRLEWDQQRRYILIDYWLDHNLPIMHYAGRDQNYMYNDKLDEIEIGTSNATTNPQRRRDMVYVHFNQHPQMQTKSYNYQSVDWMCYYKGLGKTLPAMKVPQKRGHFVNLICNYKYDK